MPRKPTNQLSPSELETRRAYMREAKRKSREGKPPEKDNRKHRDRAAYMREYRAKLNRGAEK